MTLANKTSMCKTDQVSRLQKVPRWLAIFGRFTEWGYFYGWRKAIVYQYRHLLWVLNKYFLRKQRVERRFEHFSMYLSPIFSGVSWVLYVIGSLEEDQKRIFEHVIRPGDRILDIGANLGYYLFQESVLAGPNGELVAVEPDPKNFKFLSENIRLNKLQDRIRAYPFAISDASGIGRFALHRSSNLNVLLDQHQADGEEYTSTIDVETRDISSLLQEIGPIDFMRMDIEGHEVAVLRSVAELTRHRPDLAPTNIVFEVHTDMYDNGNRNIRKHLTSLLSTGYCVSRLTTQDERIFSLRQLGYEPISLIKSDVHLRGIYGDIEAQDALSLICDKGGVRIALLSKIG